MQFIVIAKDFKDALPRRLACRSQHIESIDALKQKGHMLYGGAFLNEQGEMAGSMLVCEFPSREALEELWLKYEPYILERVWETIDIQPFRVGPSFVSELFIDGIPAGK